MKKAIFLLLLITLAIFSEDKRDGAWVKVEVINKIVIIGEPIYIRLQKYGTPYVGDIYLDGKKCDEPYLKVVPEYAVEPKGEAFKMDKSVKEKVKDVTFNILNNCNLMMKDMEEREYEVCYKDKMLKACDRFKIKYPEGEDLRVYEKMDKRARDFTFPESGIKNEELLENYPTSTYAGWAFPASGVEESWGKGKTGKSLIEDVLTPIKERAYWGRFVDNDKGKGYPKTKNGKLYIMYADEISKEYIKFAEPFLENNPGHINAGIIYFRLALAYMNLNLWEKAYDAGEKALKYEWADWYFSSYPPQKEINRRVLKEAMEEMKKRGFVRKER